MNIITTKNGSTLDLALEGRLDTNTASQLETAIQDNLAGTEELILDFKNLEYISSAGLRILLSTQKTMNGQGRMIIKNVCPDIMEVFEITGFSDILTIQK